MEINYCAKCNVPVLGDSCDLCRTRASAKLRFHDMGDIRPISRYEREILLKLVPIKQVRDYLRFRLILVARQPGLDYRRDLFVDGFKFGILEYVNDAGRWRYRFLPTGKGASLFYALSGHYDFEVNAAGHLKGKRINARFDGDWAIFRSGECTGVAVHVSKGTKVRDVFCRSVKPRKRSNIKDATRANISHLAMLERSAVHFIRNKKADYVAFSGGKDSEVALYLAHMAGVNRAVFANTGMEFPETERFVYNFADFLGVELIEVKPKRSFWDVVDDKGVPTKDSRWCTQYLKLQQLKKFKGTMVDGSRKYESMARMNKYREAKIGNMRVVYPILDWLALEVWLYLHMKGLPYNPLYDMGYERIGCFMCPAMLNSEFHNVRRTHPRLYWKWVRYLREQGYSDDDIINGKWRWKSMPNKMKSL